MDLERLLHLFLHIVAVLFELLDDLLLGISSFFRVSSLLLHLVLQVRDLLLVAFVQILQLLVGVR